MDDVFLIRDLVLHDLCFEWLAWVTSIESCASMALTPSMGTSTVLCYRSPLPSPISNPSLTGERLPSWPLNQYRDCLLGSLAPIGHWVTIYPIECGLLSCFTSQIKLTFSGNRMASFPHGTRPFIPTDTPAHEFFPQFSGSWLILDIQGLPRCLIKPASKSS